MDRVRPLLDNLSIKINFFSPFLIVFTQDIDTIFQKFSKEDTVILEHPDAELILHSLDICFQLTKSFKQRKSSTEDKIICVSNIDCMLKFVKAYVMPYVPNETE